MKNTNRYIALALCFTLTLGVFAYRPPQAEAIAGVDDAVVIGALLSAFAGGCGLIFSNNGMTSGELARGLTDKWNEFNEAAESGASSFVAWLGFEDTSALLGALSFSGSKLVIPRAIARKLLEFTTWLVDNLGVTAGGTSKSLLEMPPYFSVNGYTLTYIDFPLSIKDDYNYATSLPASFSNLVWYPLAYLGTSSAQKFYPFGSSVSYCYAYYNEYGSRAYCEYQFAGTGSSLFVSQKNSDGVFSNFKAIRVAFGYSSIGFWTIITNGDEYRVCYMAETESGTINASHTPLAPYWGSLPSVANNLSVSTPAGVQTPDLAGDEAANPTLSGVGDGTATTIEGLLQQILAQLQVNALAPTLDLAGTESGGNTGTDEDAKPYLPYIPQIFGKIKELPGTLANIWESIKSIPAAIAEKIGAFFTTLWGWLQNIIDAITALPAAIAEKIKALFVPREGYAAEFVADITATYQGRMGLLTYPFTVLADFVGTVATLEEQDPVLRWDAVEWQNKTIIAAGEYNLKSAVSSAQMQTVYMIYKTVVSGMLVVAFLHLCYKKLKEVQRN